jgi:SAM-dependent methyltransferase
MAIRLHAWQTIGFYPDHAPRLWEYPVVAGLLGDALEPQSRIIDIGAGVTPLVPYLGRAGYVVDTVDPSPVQRIWPPQPDWNEWDFLDYAAAGLAHRSWNCTLDQVPRDRQFDAAYSVSVIEHLCADDRRALIGEIAARVRTGGLVVFTIDLVRDGDDLWNRNRGIEVEEPSRHGTITDVVAEAEARGLELFQVDRVRNWGDSVVDIGLLAMVRASRPTSLGEVVRRGRMLGHRVVAAGRRLSSGS